MAWETIAGNSAGSMNGSGARRLLLHSTEGSTIEGAVAAYRKNNSWPTLTVDCGRRRVVRHLPDTVAARSLRNAPGGVETNREGDVLIQVELVGFAERPESIGDAAALDWFGRTVVGPLCARNRIPLTSTARWAPYPASYGVAAPQRLQAAAWRAYNGILGHQHVPENTHGDPGAINISRILAAAKGKDDDVTEAEMDKIASKVVAALEKRLDTDYTPIRQKLRELAKLGADDALDARETPTDPPA